MDFSFDLKEWAGFTANRPMVLTLFLDMQHRPDKRFLRIRAREIEALYRDDREIRDNFLQAVRKVHTYLRNNECHCQGLAVIADPSRDVFRTYELPVAVGNLMVLDTSPYIRPLVRLKEDWEPFGLVMMDHGQAHLYLVYLSKIQDEKELKTKLLAHQKNGGWSQGRYSRRRKNRIDDFLREVARDLGKLLRKERVNRIILAGSAEAKRQLVEYLDKDMQKKVVGFLDLSMETDEHTLLKKAFPVFFRAEKEEEASMLSELRDRLASGGLAVGGVAETAQAVMSGRAERVMVKADFKPTGWKCERCDVMEEGRESDCILCGEKVYTVDLVEEIVEYAEKTAAEVVFVNEDSPILQSMGYIGALLRY